MVIPIPDGNDTVMELLLLRSMKDVDVVTLSPTDIKSSDTSFPSRFMVSDSVLRLVPTCAKNDTKFVCAYIAVYLTVIMAC